MRNVQRLKGGQRPELPGEVVLPFELVERSLYH